ncbi:MAG: late competence development ComFB family protein [Clostridiales Family XIII bacterium]|jgi:competence protein ComFB|nr:late competence development ComFB family protein [Clostridiales Family XIII bacterium]
MKIHNSREKPVNLVRLLAEELLPSVMEKMGVPDTAENREDILALTLNSLPTKYVTTDEGKQYAQLVNVYRVQYELDIITGLTKSCMKVKARPRNPG